jgi:hypothetical protein
MFARQIADSADKGKNYRAEIETTKFTKRGASESRLDLRMYLPFVCFVYFVVQFPFGFLPEYRLTAPA